jgi:hypothetical protein
LFDYADENSVPADISGLLWQPELSALWKYLKTMEDKTLLATRSL